MIAESTAAHHLAATSGADGGRHLGTGLNFGRRLRGCRRDTLHGSPALIAITDAIRLLRTTLGTHNHKSPPSKSALQNQLILVSSPQAPSQNHRELDQNNQQTTDHLPGSLPVAGSVFMLAYHPPRVNTDCNAAQNRANLTPCNLSYHRSRKNSILRIWRSSIRATRAHCECSS